MVLVPRNISKQDALEVLDGFVNENLIRLEPATVPGRVNLDGWNPSTQWAEDGNVAGVVVRYWPTGRKGTESQIKPGVAPDRLDPRNAMAFVLMCQMLNTAWGITELYHAGISGDPPGGRNDCHGQGRAVDFVGARGEIDGSEVYFTVFDNWGKINVPGLTTANGDWPAGTGTNTSYRLLDEAAPDTPAWQFFLELYNFAATNYQDRMDGPEDTSNPTEIGNQSRFIMHPDHPKSAPGTPNGREAHKEHMHMQIGVTGTA
ncbi:hypothetical protein AB0C98_41925 [Streptomyces sp. NPDC048558]|uniref:hypothetical protein n=1 Tax=Streptomyces sp. NPDC048558 TaxID=3155759 RepID=UPI00342864D8